jgi:hypothetical protein
MRTLRHEKRALHTDAHVIARSVRDVAILLNICEQWIAGGEAVFHRSRYKMHSEKKGNCSL